jgi:hypothetical protein
MIISRFIRIIIALAETKYYIALMIDKRELSCISTEPAKSNVYLTYYVEP